MNDVWRELMERLTQKARLRKSVPFKNAPLEEWVRLEDVKEAIQQLKQRIREVFDQYVKAYPLDTPEDKLVSKVLNEIREELLKE